MAFRGVRWRLGSALNLNIHFHILFLDGVYVYRDNRPPRLQRIKTPNKDELEDLVQLISQRVGRCLERQGLLEQDTESTWLDLDPAEDNDAMPQILGSSVSYRIAAGPQQGRKAFMIRTIRPLDRPDPGLERVAKANGFSLHAGVSCEIMTVQYARENKVPYLGICLGLQVAVIEYARNVAGLKDAHSTEFAPSCENPVIALISEWTTSQGKTEFRDEDSDLGGTMRLGVYPCRIAAGTLAQRLYGAEVVYERHRHRYEFNNAYRNLFLESGYVVSGTSPDGRLVELIELKGHPFFTACQYHPEFLSRPGQPHPLFRGLIEAAQQRLPASPTEAIQAQR